MTDRLHALTVHLSADIRDDDAEPLIAAIHQLKGVAKVEPHVIELADLLARERARSEIVAKLWDAYQSILSP